jgi:hypothetical protein
MIIAARIITVTAWHCDSLEGWHPMIMITVIAANRDRLLEPSALPRPGRRARPAMARLSRSLPGPGRGLGTRSPGLLSAKSPGPRPTRTPTRSRNMDNLKRQRRHNLNLKP